MKAILSAIVIIAAMQSTKVNAAETSAQENQSAQVAQESQEAQGAAAICYAVDFRGVTHWVTHPNPNYAYSQVMNTCYYVSGYPCSFTGCY